MNTQWTPVKSRDVGVDHYRNGKAKAWIQHNADGSVDSGGQKGFFGMRTESHHFAPAPEDQVLLDRIDRSLNPPRFDGWEQKDKATPGTTYYQGEADNFLGSTVNATITRAGGAADVSAQVGWFGTHIDGHFFAPAPSDAEILKSISRRPA